MAAAAAATLAARGAKVGVLMGTAYLFTEEAVSAGAIQPAFQDVAVGCDTTVLLETAPGHATRCVETDFVRAFAARKAELEAAGVDPKARWAELETSTSAGCASPPRASCATSRAVVSVDRRPPAPRGHVHDRRGGHPAPRGHHHRRPARRGQPTGRPRWPRAPTAPPAVREPDRADPLDIAIVGMDAFLPGAVGAEEFWAEVVAGTDAVTEVPAERWDVAATTTPTPSRRTPAGRPRRSGAASCAGSASTRWLRHPAVVAGRHRAGAAAQPRGGRPGAGRRRLRHPRVRPRVAASVIFGAESGNELAGAYGIRAFLPQLFGEVPPALEDWLPVAHRGLVPRRAQPT
jgi:hypothetical protein